MRLFVAIEVPEQVRAELTQRVDRWRRMAPAARWVRSEAMHLTLLFVGELAAARLVELESALAAACARHASLALQVTGAGCFPTPAKARVLWCGLVERNGPERLGNTLGQREPPPGAPERARALAALQGDIAAAGGPFVERPDDRPFHAHLTLARCQPPWPRPAAERFVERFAPPAGEPFAVAHVALIESELAPGGSRYTILARLPLAGGTA